MNFFSLKKWYLDLVTHDGNALYLYFMDTKIAGIRRGNVSAHLLFDDLRVKTSNWHRIGRNEPENGISIGPHRLAYNRRNAAVLLNGDSMKIDLLYTGTEDRWSPVRFHPLLAQKNGSLAWNVPQPRALVFGSISVEAREINVSGYGYQDIIEMTFSPWKLPLVELLWGRAHCENYTVIFDSLVLRDGSTRKYLLLRQGNSTIVESQSFRIHRNEILDQIVILHDEFEMELPLNRIIEESPVATDDRIKPRFVKYLLAGLSGNPFEKKMLSSARLRIGNQEANGYAIHERVQWNWRHS